MNFQEEAEALRSGDLPPAAEPSISRAPIAREVPTNGLAAPDIKPAPPRAFETPPTAEAENPQENPSPVEDVSDKKSWL